MENNTLVLVGPNGLIYYDQEGRRGNLNMYCMYKENKLNVKKNNLWFLSIQSIFNVSGTAFWKVGSRKIYAVPEEDVNRAGDDVEDDDFVTPPLKKKSVKQIKILKIFQMQLIHFLVKLLIWPIKWKVLENNPFGTSSRYHFCNR